MNYLRSETASEAEVLAEVNAAWSRKMLDKPLPIHDDLYAMWDKSFGDVNALKNSHQHGIEELKTGELSTSVYCPPFNAITLTLPKAEAIDAAMRKLKLNAEQRKKVRESTIYKDCSITLERGLYEDLSPRSIISIALHYGEVIRAEGSSEFVERRGLWNASPNIGIDAWRFSVATNGDFGLAHKITQYTGAELTVGEVAEVIRRMPNLSQRRTDNRGFYDLGSPNQISLVRKNLGEVWGVWGQAWLCGRAVAPEGMRNDPNFLHWTFDIAESSLELDAAVPVIQQGVLDPTDIRMVLDEGIEIDLLLSMRAG